MITSNYRVVFVGMWVMQGGAVRLRKEQSTTVLLQSHIWPHRVAELRQSTSGSRKLKI